MKKNTMTVILSSLLMTGLFTGGCADTGLHASRDEYTIEKSVPETMPSETIPTRQISKDPVESAATTPTDSIQNTTVVQGGPYGEISLSLPDDWRYETCPMDSGQTDYGLYGIRFYPANVTDGYIALNYIDSFGVCGTGLAQEQASIAGTNASIGTYDDHIYWSFIAFQDGYKGIVALTYSVEDWWETYSGEVMEILDTLSFDPSVRAGGAYVYSRESELDEVGLSFSLKNITPEGATLVFYQYDAGAATGSLEYGDDFLLEVQKNGAWEEIPVIPGGNYAFNSVAYTLSPKISSERELDWEWLYGSLAPGTYRIQKNVMDFREPGDYDKYTVYAEFILN